MVAVSEINPLIDQRLFNLKLFVIYRPALRFIWLITVFLFLREAYLPPLKSTFTGWSLVRRGPSISLVLTREGSALLSFRIKPHFPGTYLRISLFLPGEFAILSKAVEPS